MNTQAISRKFNTTIISLLLLILTACGGGGSGSDSGTLESGKTTSQTGTVGLLVTDGPTDAFQAIYLTVTRAELLSDDGGETIFEGRKTFNLLDLENATEIFAINEAEAGAYNKIRLTLESIELILEDGSSQFPKLPGNGKLDLNPRGTFFVDPDAVLLVELDFDAKKSIHVVKTGKKDKYNFRPVVFVKIIRDSFDSKLIRLTGTARDIETDNGGEQDSDFEICDIQAQDLLLTDGDSSRPTCVTVETGGDTSFFDEEGDPSEFSDLANGDIVTVIGRFSMDMDDDDSSSRSNDSNSRSDDSKSNDSKSNDSKSQDDDSSGDDDSSSDDSDEGSQQLVLMAEVVMEDGLIETTRGISLSKVTTDPDTDEQSFEYDTVDREVSIPEQPGVFKVILQQGTRIYSRDGTELSAEDIAADLLTQVDGAEDDSAAEIRAAVVVIQPDDSAQSGQLTGTISTVEDDYSAIIVITDPDAESRCVNVENAKVFYTSLNDDNNIVFEEREASDLMSGQLVDAFGDEEVDGCLNAHTVIYQDEGAVIQPI